MSQTVWKSKTAEESTTWTRKSTVEQTVGGLTIGSTGTTTSLVTGLINQYNVQALLIDNEYMYFGADADFSMGYSTITDNLHINLPASETGNFTITRKGAFVFPDKDLSSETSSEGGVDYYDNQLYLGIGV